jgi:hypothetical protein
VVEIRAQRGAPGRLDNDLARSRIGVTSDEHLRVKYRIERGAAMNPGDVVVSELSRFGGQEVFKVPSVERRPGKQCGQDQHGSEI